MAQRPRGWHPDPAGRHELRWFDGSSWTTAVRDGESMSRHDPRRDDGPDADADADLEHADVRDAGPPDRPRFWLRRLTVAAVLVGVLVVLGAGVAAVTRDGGSDDAAGETGSSDAGNEVAESTAPLGAYDLGDEVCAADADVVGGWSLSGTLTNRTDEPMTFVFDVEFLDPSSGESLNQSSASITALAAGETSPWEAGAPVEATDVECRIVRIESFPSG